MDWLLTHHHYTNESIHTQVMTALEPCRAAAGAAYVLFAEAPEAVSQTFPLVFHRWDRIAEVRHF